MFDLFSILISIAIGALSGCIAGMIMNSKGGLLRNIILGLIGGAVGGFAFHLLGFDATKTLGKIITSVVGACLLIFVGRLIFK